jgi:hypothetical protein
MDTPRDLDGTFKPSMLIAAVQRQAPEYPWLPEVLEKCGIGEWESPAYVGYISRQKPHQPGSEWQFALYFKESLWKGPLRGLPHISWLSFCFLASS